jgi:multidrug efflux pump subunit AcrA (membrane-fusion protein)
VVTYPVRIAVDPSAATLLPGMTASVAIDADRRRDALVIPVGAVTFAQSRGAAPGTVLVLANGRAEPRVVRIGTTDGRVAEILAGLEAGEAVITGSSDPRGGVASSASKS